VTAAIVVALTLVVGLLGVLVVGLLRSHAEILRALHDLGVNLEEGAPGPAATARRSPDVSHRPPIRTAEGVPGPRAEGAPFGPASNLTGELPGGGAARVAVTGVEHSTLLAFLSTGCGTCGTFWEAFQDPDARRLPGVDARVVIVTNSADAESAAEVERLAPTGLVTLMSSDAWDDYGVPVSPYFILVDGASGLVVGEGAGSSWAQVADLLGRAGADAQLAASSTRRRQSGRGQDRAEWVDDELRRSGIEPGDPSLYPAAHPDHEHLS
jgi:hypothetical protein